MRRGDIWTVAGAGYASKPRPVIIVQSDSVTGFDSVVTVLLTTYDSTDIPTRVPIQPTPENGLNQQSWAMADKIVTVKRSSLGARIGRVDEMTMQQIGRQVAVVLGL